MISIGRCIVSWRGRRRQLVVRYMRVIGARGVYRFTDRRMSDLLLRRSPRCWSGNHTIASARVEQPKLGAWHTICVVATGPRVQAYLDNPPLLDHQDNAFTEGWVGLRTKADSVTEFADLGVSGTPAR